MRAHTFVVRGDLAKVKSDLYVLPTDLRGSIGSQWDGLLRGQHASRGLSQAQLDELREASCTALSPTVLAFNSGGGAYVDDAEVFLERVDVLLQHLQNWAAGVNQDSLERLPLVAMPLLGLGRAGHRSEVGLILKELVQRIELLQDRRYDVVLVAFSEADYAALQYLRQKSMVGTNLAEHLTETATLLANHAQHGTLAVMFGAGASVSLKIPTWLELLASMGRELGLDEAVVSKLPDLDAMDAASLLVDKAGSTDAFNSLLRATVKANQASLTHTLLANLNPSIAITTNYDPGYEIAIEAVTKQTAAVMPWDRPESGSQPRVLKLHGDVDRGSIVLSRDEFVAMQAYRKPLVGTLQERMLVGHVLVVGSSMSDSTMVHAGEEVAALARSVGASENAKAGTVILTRGNPAREQLLRRVFDVKIAASDSTVSASQAAREVDILLDEVGLLAADVSKFLIDSRYDDLLEGDELRAAKFGRELHTRTEDFLAKNPELASTTSMQNLGLFVRDFR